MNIKIEKSPDVAKVLAAAKNLEPGDYEVESIVGPVIIRKAEQRSTLMLESKRISAKDLRARINEALANPEPEEKKGSVLPDGTLDKKYKRKKVLKALDKWTGLKPKKKAKVAEAIEKIAGKKMAGHEVLAALAAGKRDLKAAKIVDFFELL